MVLIGGVALLAAVQVSLAQPAPAPTAPRMPVTFRVGPQRPDLVRYNRVEALSLGVRGQARPATPFGPLSSRRPCASVPRTGTSTEGSRWRTKVSSVASS